eukprot:jgi/Chlat1/3528/Chrsp23S00266
MAEGEGEGESWTQEEEAVFSGLTSTRKIQEFLDSLRYESQPDGAFSPRQTLAWRAGHCFGGALLAAAALRRLGHAPLVIHLDTDHDVDDDHVIAVYQVDGYWGSVSKSNYTTLRGREPVYHSIRELVMSYFDFYFSIEGVKSLVSYSDPLDLGSFDHRGPGKLGWMYAGDNMEDVDAALIAAPHHPVVTSKQASMLIPVPDYLLKAATIGSNPDGFRAAPLS